MKKQLAFSLIEMLVAMAILGILCATLAQMLVTISATGMGLAKHSDADSQARLALDRISYDISQIVQRTDIDYNFPAPASANASDEMYFFSESGGYYPTGLTPPVPATVATSSTVDPRSSISLVGYRINPTTFQLERLSKGLVWSGVTGGSPMVYLPQTIAGTWPALASDADFQVISSSVFRLQIQYLIQNTTTLPEIVSTPNLESITPGTVGYFNPKEVTAIIVSIGVLDPNSQKIIPTGALSSAAGNLAATTGTTLPISSWNASLNSLGLPKLAAAQVRFYQRFCYLPHN